MHYPPSFPCAQPWVQDNTMVESLCDLSHTLVAPLCELDIQLSCLASLA